MLHAAIFDAVNNIDRDFEPYAVRHPHVSRKASAQAAADQAAHDVLISLYPAFATTLDSELQQDLAQILYGRDKADGIEEGQDVAAAILALRSNDGSAAVLPPFVPKISREAINCPPQTSRQPISSSAKRHSVCLGPYQRISPRSTAQLTSEDYTLSFNEVKNLGLITSATRTADQTQIGQF
jgi:hypothetical protein